MNDNERVQAYLMLYKEQMERFSKTQDVEWKGNIGIWTLLAGAIYLATRQTVPVSRYLVGAALAMIVAVHCVWLFGVHRSERHDRELSIGFRNKVLALVDPSSSHPERFGRRWSKGLVWLVLESGMTTILSVVLFVLVTRR